MNVVEDIRVPTQRQARDGYSCPYKPAFEATNTYDNCGKNYLKNGDTENRILNDLAERAGDNYKAK